MTAAGVSNAVVSLRVSRAPKPPRRPRQPSPEGQFRRRDRFPQPQHEQPEFLRRPVRRPRREGNGAPTEANGGTVAEDTDHD